MFAEFAQSLAVADVICKLRGSRTCTTSWKGVCSTMLASTSTMGKPKCGTGVEGDPLGVDELTAAARLEDPEAVVWRGFKVLGAPIGHPDFVAEFLAKKSREHEVLFDRIPAMEDLQSAWLVLLFCAAPRANFWLRKVRPEMVAQFAESHDANTWGVWHD